MSSLHDIWLPTESALSSFAIVEPLGLAKPDCSIDLGPRVVHFRQLIPLFTREYEYALRVGGLVAMSEFQRNARFVPSNVKRPDFSDLLP